MLKALSETLPSWWSAIAIIAAILIGNLSLNQTVNAVLSVAILILVISSVVVITIHGLYGVLSAKYTNDTRESVSNLIDEGNSMRKPLSSNLRTSESFEEFEKANSQIDEWDQRARKVISDYDPDLGPLLNSTVVRGNPLQWVDERISKLSDLLKRL